MQSYLSMEGIARVYTMTNETRLKPVAVKDRLPGPDDLHPEEGWAWFCTPKGDWVTRLPPNGTHSERYSGVRVGVTYFVYTHWLPYYAIPYIRTDV